MTPIPPALSALAAELAALRAAPVLWDGDVQRLPVLAAALGVAVRVERWAWGAGDGTAVRSERVVGEVRE